MPRVRPTMGLHNLGRGQQPVDTQYISTCKICVLGIYKGQPHQWRKAPGVLGLVHDACVDNGKAS